MKKSRFIAVIFALVMLAVPLTACGKGPQGESENSLYVDLHSLMPTTNQVDTETVPAVNVSRGLAANFKKDTGVSIRWALERATKVDAAGAAEWYAMQIRKGDVPAIGFTYGSKLQDRDYYMDLTTYLDIPNPYVEGNTKWRDMFPEYLWKHPDIMDASGRIVSLPIVLYPGTPTGVFYNKDLVTKAPESYTEFVEAVNGFKNTATTPYAPTSTFTAPAFSQWINEFTISPNYLLALINQASNSPDFDGDGIITTAEELRGVLAGYYNANSGPNMNLVREMLDVLYDYYTSILPSGWANATYDNAWKNGTLAMQENGLWNIRTENNRNASRGFDYGVFNIPIVEKGSAYGSKMVQYAAQTEYYTEGESVESPPLVMVNLMKDGAKQQTTIDNAIKFLMYITVPANAKAMADEQVSAIGATIGSQTPNRYISDWMEQDFAKKPNAKWPTGYTTTYMGTLDLAFSKWVNRASGYTKQSFYTDYDKNIKDGASALITSLGLDTTGW